MAGLSIQYPANNGDPITVPTTTSSYDVFTFGVDDKVTGSPSAPNKIKATLTTTDSSIGPLKGKVRKQPTHWAVVFRDVTVDTSKTYQISITDTAGATATRTFVFTTVASPAPTGELRIFAVTPGVPLSGATVNGSGFYATGNTDADAIVYAMFSQPNCNPYIGNLVNPPPNYVIWYQNIPAGENYTITITEWSNPPKSNSQDDITVTR